MYLRWIYLPESSAVLVTVNVSTSRAVCFHILQEHAIEQKPRKAYQYQALHMPTDGRKSGALQPMLS